MKRWTISKLERFREWLVGALFARTNILQDHIDSRLGMYAYQSEERDKALRTRVDELFEFLGRRGRPDGSSLSLLTEMELSHEIESGKAMHEHQLRNRDRRIMELETTLSTVREQHSQTRDILSRERGDWARSQQDLLNQKAQVLASNLLLTEENKALKLRVDELEARFKEAAKSAADVGSTKPRRKSPHKAAAPRNKKAAGTTRHTRKVAR